MKLEKSKGRDFWDSNPIGGRWSSYAEKVKWALDTEAYVYELITEDLFGGKQALDVGCGAGLAMTLAGGYCSGIVGLDYSTTSLDEAKHGLAELNLSNIYLLCGDAENLPFPDNQFDVVYSLGVLHHTPDIQKAIGEIYRVLKPGGTAVIMVYRAYNPKWLAVKLVRAFSKIVDMLTRSEFYIANRLRKKYESQTDSRHGTALLELLGCPTLKTYSRKRAGEMFSQFNDVKFRCYQPGFTRLLDFAPRFLRRRALQSAFTWFDIATADTLGFYLVADARK